MAPQIQTDWSPAGQIYFFTLHSTNPAYDVMELKSIEDWVIEKNLKAVPNIVDVASFGGPTREYQVRVDPEKLISYGLSISQVEQQLTNNNANSGGSFVEAGLQQINIQEVGLVKNVQDIQNTVIMAKNGTPIRVKDIAVVAQGPKIRLGQFAKAIRHEDGKLIDNDDVVSGIALLRKGRRRRPGAAGDSQESQGTERHHSSRWREGGAAHRSQRSGELHHRYGAAQPREGIILVVHHSVPVPGEYSRRDHRGPHHPVCAPVRRGVLEPERDSGQPAVAGRAGFRHGGGWRGGDGGEHRAAPRPRNGMATTPKQQIFEAAHEVQRPVFYAIAIIITAYLPIFTLQRVEGRLFKPMAWTVAFALLGAIIFSIVIVPALASLFYPRGTKEWHNPVMVWLTKGYRRRAARGRAPALRHGRHRRDQLLFCDLSDGRRRDRLRIPAASG